MAGTTNKFPERRNSTDRRKEPTSPLTKSSFKGSRRYLRRREDRQENHFVDKYGWRGIIVVIMIINLSTLDAFLTLTLIDKGIAREGNPVMAYFLSLGTFPFIVIKYIITMLCSVTVLVFKNHSFRRGLFSGKKIILMSLLIYVGIIIYEVILLKFG